MLARRGVVVLRRMFSTTPSSSKQSTQTLPFEKPIFESRLLEKAKAETDSFKRFQTYCNLAVIAVGCSAIARLTYYIAYGKEGGALPLPRRHETASK